MPTATPDDVRAVLGLAAPTDDPLALSDADISAKLDDAEWENNRANDTDDWTDAHKKQLEKYLAALKIRSTVDRAIEEGSQESGSVVFEGSSLSELRKEVAKRDPSGTLATSVIRDSSRSINTTGE
ncbi:hypothetical protein [Haloferax sp. ATB1]|uniref:hypothetical protein n=1 Tax=Haloferax sp. ATB1 TaxID=1508454 RepID=UPI0005B2300D|nr:hypothetical protein [Haloferax sp. ATB1]